MIRKYLIYIYLDNNPKKTENKIQRLLLIHSLDIAPSNTLAEQHNKKTILAWSQITVHQHNYLHINWHAYSYWKCVLDYKYSVNVIRHGVIVVGDQKWTLLMKVLLVFHKSRIRAESEYIRRHTD